MSVLRLGSRGNEVRELQELLNRNLTPNPHLAGDGDFQQRTKDAVVAYQRANWLVADGEAGPCTMAALRGTESYVYLHPVQLVPQWTTTTCWSAATAMLLGRAACMSAGPATATAADGLWNDSDLDTPENMRRFADYHHLTLVPGATWMPDGLAGFLQRGPIMINTLWDVEGYVERRGSSGHMRVIAGIRGDSTPEGTTIRLYDPWPPNRGAISSRIYSGFIRATPAATYQILHR